ncbi:MAG TPA: immunoglobulin domain-containing protein [Verrucomicrobiae bacterium]|nr:immunoglobulin domain-containing protein [Verrucomicrobiae bacterium]
MKKYYSTILSSIALFGAAVFSANALEITIVESRTGGQNFASYHEGSGNWANSTAKSPAPGTTQISPSIGSRFATTDGPANFSVNPLLRDGATYTIDITHGTSSGIPDTFNVGVSATGGTVNVTNTPVFARLPDNVWERVGTIVLDAGVTTPTVTFTKLTAGTGRFYADAVRFTLLDPCLSVPDIKTVNGPLAAGQTFVDVPGVTNGAQAVTVYANGVQIGQKTSGVTVGVNRVTTSALVKGSVITATETLGGIESCNPSTGQLVGSGANPAIKIAVTIRQTNLTDSAIGVNGGAPGSFLKFIGATGSVGTLLAPLGAKTFYPSSDWQTVTFQRGDDWTNSIDPTFNWNAADPTYGNVLAYNFGVFDALIFTSPEDTGPFAIYIDDFKNGDTLVQGFEGATVGQSGSTFTQPSFSGTTSGFLLAQPPGTVNPNSSIVTNNTADGGSQSLLVSWQFNTTNISSCLRLAAVATTAGSTPNPIVDLRLPISFRMLILPVGQQPVPKPGNATSGPGDQRVLRTGNITLRGVYGGTPPLTFQWRHNGVDIPRGTNATFIINNAQPSDAGSYTLRVSNAYGSGESPAGTLTVEDIPFTDVMTPLWRLPAGSRPYLTNDGNTRSIAWSPVSGNLLVASRSGNSNAIYALDGDTGAFKFALLPPDGGFVGGTLVLNQIAVADDGTVYAANLTTDGATNHLKLYKWFGDYDNEPCQLVWEGNPAGDDNVHLRWGDAMTVRGYSGAHEVFVSSSGTLVGVIIPDFPSFVVADIQGATAGALRLGLATTPGDILWGKTSGSPLLRIQLDSSLRSGTILDSFTGLNTMTAIGVNSAGTLMGGVFVDTPDHLRLLDISTPGSITALDTEFFPSDNANGNSTGGVAFGLNKIYGLDSNNGLIAMNLNTDCLPDRLTIEPDGSNVILRWSRASFHLEGTTTLGSGWTPISGGSPKTLPATGNQFFRLVCP